MKYGFNVYKTQVDDHVFWIAESKDLKGCIGQGETPDEALNELQANEEEWLDAAKEYKIDIPCPTIEKNDQYSGRFVTRISSQVHKEAVENANRQGISLNQYVNNAIVTMNSSNGTVQAIKQAIEEVKSMLVISTSQITRDRIKYSMNIKSDFMVSDVKSTHC